MSISGFSLIEVVVSMGFFSVIVFSSLQLFLVSSETQSISRNHEKAASLTNEYFEEIKNIRRDNWNNLLIGRFSLLRDEENNLFMEATVAGEAVENYHRYVEITNAQRDINGSLDDNGAYEDLSTKKITVTVSWTGPHNGSVSKSSYLTRYFDNLSWTQTTETEFNAGTHSGTTATDTAGGEVILGAGGQGNWCDPTLEIQSLDLPKNGVANALTAIEGQAFAATGDNASGVSFANISISNTNPPIATIQNTFDGYKTNGVFGETDYAYLATDSNSKEIVIINLATNTEVGYFNTPFSSSDATSVYVSGNRGYVTAGSFLYIFDLSSKNGSRPIVSFPFLLLGTGTSIVVKENYAYVSISGSPIEMQIINIASPLSIFQVGYADVNGQDGKRVFVNDTATRAYLVTNASASLKEFFIIDISSKSGSRPIISSYEANGMNPKSLAIVTGNKAIIVGSGGEEYQVIDITNESNPIRCGGLQINTNINDISSILETDGDAFSYIITGDANAEFRIIEGGPGGHYSASGMYESQTLDTNYSTAFNRFFVTIQKSPPITDIKYKVAVKDALNFSCAEVAFSDIDFVGPSGDNTTYFEDEGAVPYNQHGQCFRFRTYLETADFTQTPSLFDFMINYSP